MTADPSARLQALVRELSKSLRANGVSSDDEVVPFLASYFEFRAEQQRYRRERCVTQQHLRDLCLRLLQRPSTRSLDALDLHAEFVGISAAACRDIRTFFFPEMADVPGSSWRPYVIALATFAAGTTAEVAALLDQILSQIQQPGISAEELAFISVPAAV